MQTIEQKIEKAQSNLDAVNKRIADLKQKAKTFENELSELKKEKQRQELAQFADVISKKGLDLDAIMKAIQDGSFDVVKGENTESAAADSSGDEVKREGLVNV